MSKVTDIEPEKPPCGIPISYRGVQWPVFVLSAGHHAGAVYISRTLVPDMKVPDIKVPGMTAGDQALRARAARGGLIWLIVVLQLRQNRSLAPSSVYR